ncbi:MAG: hypothetical protein L0387_09145 [Acidobacteria bacterium]|nr:hypothetical protein [Acidobacteriota bacterium]
MQPSLHVRWKISGAIRSHTAPKDTNGISFAPTLRGQKQPERSFLYREFPGYGGQQCVRIGDWKGIRQNLTPPPASKSAPDFTIQLFNLRDDPAESKDMAAKYPHIVNKIAEVMRAQHVASAEFLLPALDQVRIYHPVRPLRPSLPEKR